MRRLESKRKKGGRRGRREGGEEHLMQYLKFRFNLSLLLYSGIQS